MDRGKESQKLKIHTVTFVRTDRVSRLLYDFFTVNCWTQQVKLTVQCFPYAKRPP